MLDWVFVARFEEDIDSEEVRQKVAADRAEGERLGVEGTPTFFVDGRRVNDDNLRQSRLKQCRVGRNDASRSAPDDLPFRRPRTFRLERVCRRQHVGEPATVHGAAQQRQRALEVFSHVYAPIEGEGEVIRYFGQTGLDAQKGADILRTVPAKYTSSVKYPAGNPVAANLRGVVQVMNANLGTRIFYTSHGSFDTHSNEAPLHAKLWKEVSEGIAAFYDDVKEHHMDEDIILFLWSEFGRRVKDNGSGTDHGAGGVAFVIGESVKGGMYGEFPSLAKEKLTQDPEPGNLLYNVDFRQLHATIAGQWMGLDDKAICNGTFEHLPFLN